MPAVMDQFGRPISSNGKPRATLTQLPRGSNWHRLRAEYDAARDTDEFKNYWANSDQYDADSANSRPVREKLVPRSRYDVYSNGYADGIAQTYATDTVGVGPKLRMQTGSQGFNQMIEMEFNLWSQAVQLRRKLWCLCHAKHTDGEGFAVIRTNPNLNHSIKVDLTLYETEQIQTPDLEFFDQGAIDGVHFDQFGNPTYYDLLRRHPGSSTFVGGFQDAERIPARFMLQWFKLRRPGQHRGIPESTSTLNMGAAQALPRGYYRGGGNGG